MKDAKILIVDDNKKAFSKTKCKNILQEETENGWWNKDVVNILCSII